jgi:radical SAM protein with 4Fe4S-binding SPASM domain
MLFIKSEKTAVEVDDYSKVRDEFIAELNKTIDQIFNKNESFVMTRKPEKCKYCAYSALCMR